MTDSRVPQSARRDAGIEIVDVQRGPRTARGFRHYLAHEIQCLTEAAGKGVLQGEWRRLAVPGLGEIGGKESVDYDGGDLSLSGTGQAVAAFDLGEEPLGHEEALLFKGGRKHHIYPQLVSPVRLAHDRQVIGMATPDA
jgi:hypothetical protein